jgi:glycosyltransferase involved in cell wall biosynthesis
LHGKRNTKKYTLIRNAIDTEKFKFNPQLREEYREKFNISNEVVIGHVGRFHPQKNHHFMIQIATELKKQDFRFKMVFVGTGELFDEINNMSKQNSLEENIIFTGKTSTPEDYYHMMDVYIQPSKFEGLGISVVEAQMNGLFCLISDAIPDEVCISENFRKLSIESPLEWVESTKSIKIKRYPVEGDEYNIKKTVTILENHYNHLL